MQVVVLGAGISGLSVAAGLTKRGFKVSVIEKQKAVGGLAASFTKNGFVFDLGPHIFFGKKGVAQLEGFFNSKDVLFENSNLTRGIIVRDELFSYPFQIKEILSRIDRKLFPRIAFEVLANCRFRRNDCANLEEWVKRKIGRTLFDYIELNTYVSKLYGLPACEISSDWGKHRLKPIANLSVWRVLSKLIVPRSKDRRPCMHYCYSGFSEDDFAETGFRCYINR